MKDEVQGRSAGVARVDAKHSGKCDVCGLWKEDRQCSAAVPDACTLYQHMNTPTPIADSSAQKSAPSSIGSLPSGESDPSVMLGFDGADTNSCPADSSEAGTGGVADGLKVALGILEGAHLTAMRERNYAKASEYSGYIKAVEAALSAPVGEPVAPADPDMPDLRLCSFNYLAAEMRRRGATVTPAPHGGDFANG